MRNTRENIIELLKEKVKAEHKRREDETDEWVRDRALHMAMAYQEAIWFLTDEKYFIDIENIYKEQ